MIEAVLTPAMFRNRAYDCQSLAERAPNQRVRDILLDMARTWTRLALEAEEWRRDNSPSRLLKNWGARLTLEHESDSCAVERAAGGIHARFGYTDR